MHEGSLVTFPHMQRPAVAIIARWRGDPDTHAVVISIRSKPARPIYERHLRYVDPQFLFPMPPAMAEEHHERIAALLAFLETEEGAELIAPPTKETPPSPPARGGSPELHDVPLILADGFSSNLSDAFSRYITTGSNVRDWLRRRRDAGSRDYDQALDLEVTGRLTRDGTPRHGTLANLSTLAYHSSQTPRPRSYAVGNRV